uniref:Peptidase S1 domain-containing protein n=1 Tax=Amphilophus citrinellus TaxID=61819 RepID=A0A3Q0RB56_AMPCI
MLFFRWQKQPVVIKLLSFSGITVSAGVDLHKRIYGGQKCPKREHLYYVKITAESSGTYCGGSLIHPQWVLTAAHCWKPGWTKGENHIWCVLQDDTGRHDIILLKLSAPSKITPVALPDFPGQPSHLQYGNMHVVDCEPTRNSKCYSNLSDILKQTYHKLYFSLSQGDSGGGVIYNNMIYGVHKGGGKCACTRPAVSVKVCSYLNWIQQTIGQNNGK